MSDLGLAPQTNPFLGYTAPVYDNTPNPQSDFSFLNAQSALAARSQAAAQPSAAQIAAAQAVTRSQNTFQSNLVSYVNKWQGIAPYADKIGRKAVESIRDYDATRIASGKAPLSTEETAVALRAAATHQAQTKPPERGTGPLDIVKNFVGDAVDFGKGIGSLIVSPFEDLISTVLHPQQYVENQYQTWHEALKSNGDWQDKLARVWAAGVNAVPFVRKLPELGEIGSIPQQFGAGVDKLKAMDKAGASTPQEISQAFANVLSLPGVRMLPGAATVTPFLDQGGSAKAGAKHVAQHPLLTILDLLPYAEGAAGRTAVGAAAEEAGLKPLPAVITKRIGEDGALEANVVGQGVNAAKATPIGNVLERTFGKVARDVGLRAADTNAEIQTALYEPSLEKVPQQIKSAPGFAEARQLLVDTPKALGVDQARVPELTDLAIVGDPLKISALPDNEFQLVKRYQDISNSLADTAVEAGQLIRDSATGEVYRPSEWQPYARRRDTLYRVYNKVLDKYGVLDDMGNPNPTGRLARWAVESADPRLADLFDAIHGADFEAAKKIHSDLSRTKIAPGSRYVGAEEGPKGFTSSAEWRNLGNDLEKLRKLDRSLANKPLPARFSGTVAQKVSEEIIGHVDPAVRDQAIDLIMQGRYRDALIPTAEDLNTIAEKGIDVAEWQRREVAKLTAGISRTWEQLKAEGYDPVFMSRVGDRNSVLFPDVRGGKIETPGYLKKRSVIPDAPFERDLHVGLTHQAMEMLRLDRQQTFAQEIIDAYGQSGREVADAFDARARKLMERNPTWDYPKALEKAMGRQWGKFDPEAVFGPGHKIIGNEDVVMPRVVLQTLNDLNKVDQNVIRTVLDPATGLFRTSVVGLSPRNNINNLLGGLMMSTVEDPGILKPRNLIRAWRFAKSTGDAAELLRGVAGDDPAALETLRNSPAFSKFVAELGNQRSDVMELQYASGAKLRRLMDKAGFLEKIADKNLWLNGFVDDIFRSAQMTRGIEKAIRAGVDLEGAAAEGLALTRKVSLNWKMLTPLERSVIRPLVPFYSWLRHITAFTFNYPLDHPIRTELLANLMQPELDDEKTGLPRAFRDLLFLGGRGALGRPGPGANQTAINVGSFNPFGDPEASWGLLGFLTGDAAQAGASVASVSPILKVLMETVGFDPRSGTADIYPELSYDPRAGGLVPTSKNPLVNIATSLIPQAGSALKLVGVDPQFKDMARSNPEAARRALWSGLGVPLLWRGVNVDQEYGKAEVTRYQAEQKAISTAIKTGDYDLASQYPGLREMIGQIQQLQAAHPELFQQQNVAQMSAEDVKRQLIALGGG